MPPRDIASYLRDIERASEGLLVIATGRTYEELLEDLGFRWSIERGIQNIGEAMFQIKKLDHSVAERIDQNERIIGCRHILVHAYFEVRPQILWGIIDLHLVPLQVTVRDMLRALDEADNNEA